MKIRRFESCLRWIISVLILMSAVNASEEDSESAQTDKHENLPRFFGFFSRPKPEADKETGVGLKQHIGNVLQGGSIGFHTEFRPMEKIHGILDHAKKIVPIPGFFGVREYGKDPTKIYPEDKPHDNVESEDTFGWVPQDPKKEKPVGPKWEDIGEDEDDEDPPSDYVSEPIEHVINPRIRPKRFIQSKIYHVPLEFLSNAKPVEVRFKSENDI